MKNTHQILVNNTYSFALEETNLAQVNFTQIAPDTYHIIHQSKGYTICFEHSDMDQGLYTLRVNQQKFTVAITNPLASLIAQMGYQKSTQNIINQVKAPMPGLLLEIYVTKGQKVSKGDNLMVLEAMKMENLITAPRDGIIAEVPVALKETVEKEAVLLTFEPQK